MITEPCEEDSLVFVVLRWRMVNLEYRPPFDSRLLIAPVLIFFSSVRSYLTESIFRIEQWRRMSIYAVRLFEVLSLA